MVSGQQRIMRYNSKQMEEGAYEETNKNSENEALREEQIQLKHQGWREGTLTQVLQCIK